ncbi:hypothetical protein IPM19_04245 [bacterium]|nr:MAG: hypothetical protein IPM19_04245 [bacterium]
MNNLSTYLPISESFGAIDMPTLKRAARSLADHVIPHERNNYHPHALSHRVLALLSILVVTIKVASISFVALGPTVTADAAAITNETIVSLANSARVDAGMGELTTSGLLAKAAQNKADDMLARQYFSHNTPDGATPWSFIKAVGYKYTTAGENLAIDFTVAEDVQSAWMNSPGHRANILNKNFTQIGIGIAKGTYDNHQTTIVVQMFANPLNAPVATQDKPTQVAAAPAPQPAPSSVPQAAVPAASGPLPVPSAQSGASPLASPAAVAQPVVATPGPNNLPLLVTPVNPAPLQIIETKTSLQGDKLYLEIQASENTVKAMAFFGNSSVMLDPIGNGLWKADISIASLGQYDNLVVQVTDMNGQMHQQPVAEFSRSLNVGGNVEGAQVTIFGTSFNPKVWEQKSLLLILAGILTALILAIAIKRHVQHLSLVANASFVAMLIAMLLIV